MQVKEFLKQHVYIILGVLCIAAMGVLFLTSARRPAEREGGELLASAGVQAEAPGYVVVHILGEVHTPGVFTLPADARVVDAVERAGGHTQNADLTRINLAVPLQDAMQIIVPALGEHSDAPPAQDDGLINLNIATSAQLQTLPGVGPARAQSIIDYREAVGGFTRVDELLNISGIGNATLENLRPLVVVR
jgi:competence protein ComEA